MSADKKFFVATAMNWGEIDVEWLTDPLAYGRAVKAAERQHDKGEVDTWIHGDNTLTHPLPGFGHLWIAHHGDLGLEVESFSSEEAYKDRLVELKNEPRVDTVIFNGEDVDPKPEEDDADEQVLSSIPGM